MLNTIAEIVIDHDMIRSICAIIGVIGGGVTGIVFVIKVALFFGKVLARMDSIDTTLKGMSHHGEAIVELKGDVKNLKDWRTELLEDSRAGFASLPRKSK